MEMDDLRRLAGDGYMTVAVCVHDGLLPELGREAVFPATLLASLAGPEEVRAEREHAHQVLQELAF